MVEPGTEGLAAVVAEFGDRGAGRRRPGSTGPRWPAFVFADLEAARERLNAILHPLVRARGPPSWRRQPRRTPSCVHDVPLLVENGQAGALRRRPRRRGRPAETRVARLVAAGAAARPTPVPASRPRRRDEQRRAVADVVLDNSGTPEALLAQVDRFWADRVGGR